MSPVTRLAALLFATTLPFCSHAAVPVMTMPPGASVSGKSPADYSAAWWQWALAQPDGQRAYQDNDGHNCGLGQIGPVWFLAGTQGTTVATRRCKVPTGKHLFFPVINMMQQSLPSKPSTCAEVQAGAAANNDHIQYAIVKIDDVVVPDVSRFRVRTAQCFEPYARAKYLRDAKAYAPAASDGYWLMLEPLSLGRHHISVRANYANPQQPFGKLIQYFDYVIDIVNPDI